MKKSLLVLAAFVALCFIPGARAQVTQTRARRMGEAVL
jgi:hypothetical protein